MPPAMPPTSVDEYKAKLTQVVPQVLEYLTRAHAYLDGPTPDISETAAFVHKYLDPIRELLDLDLVLLVAHANSINELLQRAYNAIRFNYALRGLMALDFPWHYDSRSSLSAIFAIIHSATMCETARRLRGSPAASFLDHILQALRGTEPGAEFEALIILAQQIITLSCELPNSVVCRGVRRGIHVLSTDSWNVFRGSCYRLEVLICDLVLPSDVAQRDEALKRLRLRAFSWSLPDAHEDLRLMGVSSDAMHPLSLVFEIETANVGGERV